MPFERTCSSCHHRLTVHIPAVSFIPRGPSAGGAGQRGQGAAAGPATRLGNKPAGLRGPLAALNGVLKVGEPLPAFGTCKHYRHSYRWLRFPCCGGLGGHRGTGAGVQLRDGSKC